MGDKVGERVGERGEVKVRGAFESNSVWEVIALFGWPFKVAALVGYGWLDFAGDICGYFFFFFSFFSKGRGVGGKQTFSSRHRHSQSRVLLFNHTQNPRAPNHYKHPSA